MINTEAYFCGNRDLRVTDSEEDGSFHLSLFFHRANSGLERELNIVFHKTLL